MLRIAPSEKDPDNTALEKRLWDAADHFRAILLRDVRSRVYFEKMKGRGTGVLTPTDLQSVSGADARAKTDFVLVGAVGVCESNKTESRPLDHQPTIPLKTLLQRVLFPGGRDEDTLTTLAGCLARLDREISRDDAKKLAALSDGKSLSKLSGTQLRAIEPDAISGRDVLPSCQFSCHKDSCASIAA